MCKSLAHVTVSSSPRWYLSSELCWECLAPQVKTAASKMVQDHTQDSEHSCSKNTSGHLSEARNKLVKLSLLWSCSCWLTGS